MVDLPEGAKTIGCKWIFKLKAGGIFKARHVAKGFRQTHGIDYDETFSPIVMLKSIRILLAVGVSMLFLIMLQQRNLTLNIEIKPRIIARNKIS